MKQYQIDFVLSQEQLRRRREHKEHQQKLGKLLADAYSVGRLEEILQALKEVRDLPKQDNVKMTHTEAATLLAAEFDEDTLAAMGRTREGEPR